MSAEITVFLPRLPKRGIWPWSRRTWTAAELNREIAAAGFDMRLDDFRPETQTGYVPCTIQGVRSGFEFYSDSIEEYLSLVDEMRDDSDFPYSDADLELVKRHASVVQLSTHWRPREYAAAAVAAACLARMTGGTVLDEPPWKWYAGDAAIAWARKAVATPDAE